MRKVVLVQEEPLLLINKKECGNERMLATPTKNVERKGGWRNKGGWETFYKGVGLREH